ncbi:MAG: PIG-L deacetylase family protein [Bacteroidales bacterium]|nr:PIG-L deacetylase family protein [Bacteroidales bacterium]
MKRSIFLSLLLLAMVMPAFGQNTIVGKYKKALIIGAHPDDPEFCCGGTALVLQKHGCEVVNVYLTGGEAGIKGVGAAEARAIRTKEATDACAIMGVRFVMLSQVDGATEITKERYAELKAVIEREKPDVVFTHWPIDSHRDHRICSVLTYDAWRQLGHSFDLYYHEAMTGLQTQNWHPDTFVDISDVVEQKHQACRAHVSQDPDDCLKWHIPMERFHGGEYQCRYAESFTKQVWNPARK